MRKNRFLAAVMTAFAFPSAALCQDTNFEADARKAFASAIEQYKIPGLVVGVTRKGEHQFYATGLASRTDNRAVTPDTLFELGSISKIFNATLAALAEQRGQLSLKDQAARYLCENECTLGNDLTLMDLATHHSGGLPLQIPDTVANTQQLVDWLKGWKPSHPGYRSYSNISIGLLGHITSHAMNVSYREAIEKDLFPKLGLRNTWIDVPTDKSNEYAFGYDRKTDQPIRVTPGVLDAEAYGVKSSARDMLQLLDVELGVAKVSPEIEAAVSRTQEGQFLTKMFVQDMIWEQYPWPTTAEAMKAANTYDFILHPQPMEKIDPVLPPQKNVVLNKTGSTNGFGGYVAVLPGEGMGIVVLANRNYPNDARISATFDLIKALLSE